MCNISYTSSQMFAMPNNILEDKHITDLNLIHPMHLMSGVNGVNAIKIILRPYLIVCT